MTYCDKDTAKEAVKKLNRYEIKPNRRMIVKLSVQFNRLYVGGIPKTKSKDDIFTAFSKEVDSLKGMLNDHCLNWKLRRIKQMKIY